MPQALVLHSTQKCLGISNIPPQREICQAIVARGVWVMPKEATQISQTS